MNFKKVLSDISFACLQHKEKLNKITQALGIITTIREKKYFDAVRISIDTIEKLGGYSYHPDTFFNIQTGWSNIFEPSEGQIVDLFIPLIEKYQTKTFNISYNPSLHTLPNNIKIVLYATPNWRGMNYHLLFDETSGSKDDVREFLIDELYASFNSNCIVLNREKQEIEISAINLKEYNSEMAGNLYSYIQKSMELNLPRAIMLCGLPGAGKSCVSSTLLKRLNLRTLIVKDFGSLGYDTVMAAIKLFKTEAILIDDFDHSHINDNSSMLGFLEQIRENIKVIIATTNSMDKFHKALVRPGRFDKIILANKLDDNVVKTILGDDLIEHFDSVKNWPVAYVNEFVLSVKLEGKDKAQSIIKDLQKRATSATFDLELNTYIDGKIEEAKDIPKTA